MVSEAIRKISTFTRSEINIFLHQFLERTQQLCRDAAILPKRNKNCLLDSSILGSVDYLQRGWYRREMGWVKEIFRHKRLGASSKLSTLSIHI